ncbi:hypothetical protein B0H17DRAFT_1216835 [Mycena rosella]|uniref:N-acetyltransferase domain-containing protein n=1 Tax=Mycena rosella TaxID=1033263 RepID=A0AAD7FQM7_MYCRO|nr:hypothetical protein B0H17DRAFT_1216835 [Mycena rosella]
MAHPTPYVRDARLSDFDEMAAFSALAFAGDPEMNWFAGLTTALVDAPPAQNSHGLRNLEVFMDYINRSVHVAGGRLTVVAIPQADGGEKLVAFAAWVPPGKNIDSTMTLIRAKGYRSVWTWGLSVAWRAGVVFKPTINGLVVEITATDPEYQGKGYAGMLMRENEAHIDDSKPITLEATTTHSRDVYARLGFEVIQSLTLGKGDVNQYGLKVKDRDAASGFTVWIMIKWPKERVTVKE